MASSRATPELHCDVTVQDFLNRYEIGATVGVGGFAVVKKGKDKKTGQPVAIKVVDKSRYATGDNSLQREIQVLCKVQHPNCISLYAVYITPRKVYLVTELVTGGELLDRVTEKGNYSEKDASDLIRQVLEGVAYLHSQGIVHRDLKLENMLMVDRTDKSPIKIADFGLSKFFAPGTVLSTMCGSPQYVAPEILGISDGNQAYSPAVDMWSMGVILFILLSGYSPFDDENDAVLFEKIKKGEYDADDPIWDNVSVPAKDLVVCTQPAQPPHPLADLSDCQNRRRLPSQACSFMTPQDSRSFCDGFGSSCMYTCIGLWTKWRRLCITGCKLQYQVAHRQISLFHAL
ncbi:hypothetical protein ABBQ32_011709 [Trebouxia sp. C0010 RCD-2024]